MSKICEKGIYESWYENIIAGDRTAMRVDVRTRTDILELQNFFLVCQRLCQQYGSDLKLELEVTCQVEDEFRIKHYLYLARFYKNIKEIRINGRPFNKMKEVNFYRIFPIILVDRDMLKFLSMKVSTIAELYNQANLINENFLQELSLEEEIPDREQLLLRICINNLIGELGESAQNFFEYRKKYFQKKEFYNKIENLPFLALVIFSAFMRTKNIDAIQYRKQAERIKRNISRVKYTEEMTQETFPEEEEIDADIFNAWDITDGLLQLVENIVFHAGYEEKHKSKNGNYAEGEGILLLRLHMNDISGVNSEFNEDSELFQRFSQYFRGYCNEYIEGKDEERLMLSQAASALSEELSHGYYVDNSIIENYEMIRRKIEKRRRMRQKAKYFWEIQVSDFSGKYMCDVFRENLKRRNDPYQDQFSHITVRSFFDPVLKKMSMVGNDTYVNERNIWKSYYEGDNGIQHYGLQIFLSIITNNEGSFDVKSFSERERISDYYSNTGARDSFGNMLPGTKYSILLPMTSSKFMSETLNTFMNTDINYSFEKLESFEAIRDNNSIIEKFYTQLREESKVSRDRTVSAGKLRELLKELSVGKRLILFDCRNMMDNIEFEIFCKTLILLIAKKEFRGNSANIAITHCDTNHFVNFIRFFSIYYDKNGNCDWMDTTQIYLCGEISTEEFLISGCNIQEMIGRVEKLAFSRRMNTRCQHLLMQMLEQRFIGVGESNQDDSVSFTCTPFDLLIKNEKKQTVFEQNVLKVLERNIQTIESGCKIHPTHMRLGSKIHIHSFYEAELLFYNNYYVNRFAYLLAERLMDLQPDSSRPIWFVGYETYSEMLICRLRRYIDEYYKGNNYYSIYETARGVSYNQEENFRYCEENLVKEMIKKNAQIFFVVPINSTLTTFNKIQEAFMKRIQDLVGRRSNRISICGYLGIIQVRAEGEKGEDGLVDIEKRYWTAINEKEKWIQSKKLFGNIDSKAYYLISIQTIWEDPIKCEKCYPEECLFEIPLIETDRTSVVPTQLIGLLEDEKDGEKNIINSYESWGKIDSLINHFYYDHVQRGNNHYQIYVRTANYFKDYSSEIKKWMRDKVAKEIKAQKKGDKLSFDVLVNPLHFSNTAFVEAINEEVFNGASYTLRIDVEKEFRDNVETKFSDLKVLYYKLKNMNIQSEMNFHFVDDSINLGESINRMRHLVEAMFPDKALRGEECVRVNVFQNVIVLLNRLSRSSIRGYVGDVCHYFYYLDLRISSMRTHEDACYLCKEVSNAKKLGELSVTNKLVDYWQEKIKDYDIKNLREAKEHKYILDAKSSRYYKKYYKRIFCAHTLNSRMVELGMSVNDPIKVLRLIVSLIGEKQNENDFLEFMMSYLYIYAHPFVAYRKSCHEGAFTLIIILLECLVMNQSKEELYERVSEKKEFCLQVKECIEVSAPLLNEINEVRDKAEYRKQYYDLFKLLLHLSAELKGNYITRSDRITKILAFNSKFAENEEEREKFLLYYLALIKRILALNLDESKSTHFEQMLFEQSEIMMKACEKESIKQSDMKKFLKMLYVENTPVIYGAVRSLQKVRQIDRKTLGAYFYENYGKILEMNQIDNPVRFSDNLLKLYQLLEKNSKEQKKKGNDGIAFYELLSEKIRLVLGAESVRFAIKTEERILKINQKCNVVYQNEDNYKTFAESSSKRGTNDDTSNIMRQITGMEFLLDTFLIHGEITLVRFPILLGKASKKSVTSGNEKLVFIIIDFGNENQRLIIQRLRFLLLLRNDIINCLLEDFDNNIIQEWLEKSNIMTQLRKARSSFHADDDNQFDFGKVWTISSGYLFGDEEQIDKHCIQYKDKLKGCILGLMMNIRIGRSNILLLSGGNFSTEEIKKSKKLKFIKDDINALKKIFFFEKLIICDKFGQAIPNKEIFSETTYDRIMAKGKDGKYFSFRDYLLYFIFELFHSAYIHGQGDETGNVQVKVYDEGKYLFFENQVTDSFKKENVESGLRREEAGISLATICEFFIYNYENRYVYLNINSGRFVIGIPIFATED